MPHDAGREIDHVNRFIANGAGGEAWTVDQQRG
jgi:hypothetical protein